MKIRVHKKIKSKKGALVVPVFEEDIKKTPNFFPDSVKEFIKEKAKNNEFKGEKGEGFTYFIKSKILPPRILVVSFGKKKDLGTKIALEVGGKIGKSLKKNKINEITILIQDEFLKYASQILEGILIVQYDLGKFKTNKKKKYSLDKFFVVPEKKDKNLKENLEKAELKANALNYVKDLVNSPANIVDSEYLAREARRIAKQNRYKFVILGEKEIRKLKMGGILAVNSGSGKEAKLLVLEHDGGKRKEKPIVIIGKGVVFDTGGYNLKQSIDEMQQDMAGGANILGLFSLFKKLKIQKNIIGVIPVVENLINEKAYKPSDIITTFSGKTVEITNTDAEGRIILSDAITYATKLDPEAIITIATLTGTVAVALGDRFAGILGNDDELLNKLKEAGDKVDDLVWPLPLHDDYSKKLKSDYADLKNYDLETGRLGATSKAAEFLKNFVEDRKWCHIDIGGTAFTSDPKKYQTKGATAHGFKLLLEFFEN